MAVPGGGCGFGDVRGIDFYGLGSADWSAACDRHFDRVAVATRAIACARAGQGVMESLNEPIRSPLTLDVSGLPSVAFGHRNTTWLANVLFMTIEGMMFALMFATYFYLRTRSTDWPPGHLPPDLRWGLANGIVFLLSIVPAWWVRKIAPSGDRRAIRNGLLALSLFALAAIVLRVLEFATLNCRWTDDAYSSTVWVLIGMHSGHLITELIETVALLAISLTPKMEGRRLADAAINSDYWYFVVITALIVDFLIYGTTRFL
jgi:cytochrome c oxidase subunit I+III